jgi:hypothetical protein
MVACGLDKETQFWAYFLMHIFTLISINFDLNVELRAEILPEDSIYLDFLIYG